MHFFQVKGVIGPCLVSTPLKNHCFAFWLQEEVAEQQDHKAGVLTLPHSLTSTLTGRKIWNKRPHFSWRWSTSFCTRDQWHAPKMTKDTDTFSSTWQVLGARTWKDGECYGFYSRVKKRKRKAQLQSCRPLRTPPPAQSQVQDHLI